MIKIFFLINSQELYLKSNESSDKLLKNLKSMVIQPSNSLLMEKKDNIAEEGQQKAFLTGSNRLFRKNSDVIRLILTACKYTYRQHAFNGNIQPGAESTMSQDAGGYYILSVKSVVNN